MAIAHLTDEQTRTWTREQKDRWWFENFYRGDMAQLSLRAALSGFFMGGFLSATNLYIGGKTGVSLGVGLTSVILAFTLFRALAKAGIAQDFTILENNALQSICTSAGYVVQPLIASLAAYMLVTGKIIPWWQIVCWLVIVSLLGVLVAFPMKRRFINDEQLPFPEGAACGVVLDALYNSGQGSQEGVYKARLLGIAAGIAALWQFLISEPLMKLVQFGKSSWHISERLDDYYYLAAAKWSLWTPAIAGVPLKTLGLRLTADIAMIGVGGLMGIRVATSVFIGAAINFLFLAPWMINRGDIVPPMKSVIDAAGAVTYVPGVINRVEIVNQWSLWWGVTMMVVGSLVALVGKPELFTSAFRAITGGRKKQDGGSDVLKDVELPLWISFVGIPILGVLAAWLNWVCFGVPWYWSLLALPLIFVLSVICTNSMALTSWTPTGSLSKITQFSFGAIDRTNPSTNLMTAAMTSEIASNAANLLSDIKPGYMLGAKPRQQAVGHVIGLFAGALTGVGLFFLLFLPPDASGVRSVSTIVSEQFAMPAALQWKGVADLIARGIKSLPSTALWSMGIAAVIAAFIEIVTIVRRRPFPISTVSVGLGVILPPESSFAMWVGALLFWWMKRKHTVPGSPGHRRWVEGMEPICAGLISGAALVGIAAAIVSVLVK